LSREYGENEMVELEVDAPESLLRRLSQFVVKEPRTARKPGMRRKPKKSSKPAS
jgi:hypothetical protein